MNNLGGRNDYQARQAGINPTHLCKLVFSKVTCCKQNTDPVLKKVESKSQDKGKLTMSGEREL